jgi:hypothetical protein
MSGAPEDDSSAICSYSQSKLLRQTIDMVRSLFDKCLCNSSTFWQKARAHPSEQPRDDSKTNPPADFSPVGELFRVLV